MFNAHRLALACAWLFASSGPAHAGPKAEVIHWWTSGGESAAVKQVAQAYRSAGGVWVDTAIAGGDQSRSVTINRIVGGNAPTAAQFNTSRQFLDLIEQDMLNNVDELAHQRAINSDAFRKVLLAFKRLQSYADPASPGRNWNDATVMLVSGKGGVQIMGDWAKGEFTAAKQNAGQQFGCIAGLGVGAPYVIQGDVLVFPKTTNADALKAQKLLAGVIEAPATQLAFSKLKGSIPARTDIDASQADQCAQKGIATLKDRTRVVGVPEVYLSPDLDDSACPPHSIHTTWWFPIATRPGCRCSTPSVGKGCEQQLREWRA